MTSEFPMLSRAASRHWRWLAPIVLTLACATPALWACSISPINHDVRYVGDKATDANCTDDDIQSAIENTVCPNTVIMITHEHTYTAQHLNVQDKSLSLVGVADGVKCNPPPVVCGDPNGCGGPPVTAPLLIISGAGHTGDSVLTIKGNSTVSLRYLQITGGSEVPTSHGGGIFYDGTGTLSLDTSTVNANNAGYGAGVYMKGEGGPAILQLKDYVQIVGNTAAVNGGGVMAEGTARVYALGSQVMIGINHAPNGYGGGMYISGPARADVGASGYGSLPVIYGNNAKYGGGVTTASDGSNDGFTRFFTTDPEHPIAIQGNTATVAGGGLYLRSPGGSTRVQSCLFDARVNQNIAPEGAAAYLDDNQGAMVFFNYTARDADTSGAYPCAGESAASLGAVACAGDAACNQVNGNAAVDGSNVPSGGVLYVGNQGIVHFWNMHLQNNRGNYGFDVPSGNSLDMVTCLVAQNTFSREVIALENTYFDAYNCTFADDIIDATHVITSNNNTNIVLHDNIFAEAGTLTLGYPGNLLGNTSIHINTTLSNDITTLPGDVTNRQGDPLFVDAAQGNFHLAAFSRGGTLTASPAIDAAPAVGRLDLDGRAFDVDVPGVSNGAGVRDLGAYEMQPITDRVFADGLGDAIMLVY